MHYRVSQRDWRFVRPFSISYMTREASSVVELTIEDGGLKGRGETSGVSYLGETVTTLISQLESFLGGLTSLPSRADIDTLLPPGGARSAVDCALWDLEAKRTNRRAWELAGVTTVPRPLQTSYTLGLGSPEDMASRAREAADYPILKIKLDGDGDIARLSRIRDSRPDALFFVDANQAWTSAQLVDAMPQLVGLGVSLIEQPLPRGGDAFLAEYISPIPLCADESCQTIEDLHQIIGRYQAVCIKLDKTGGLTEALRLATAARSAGLKTMAGCMGGSSLSMAPAFVLGQVCDHVDLDSPLLLSEDVEDGIEYEGAVMQPFSAALWG